MVDSVCDCWAGVFLVEIEIEYAFVVYVFSLTNQATRASLSPRKGRRVSKSGESQSRDVILGSVTALISRVCFLDAVTECLQQGVLRTRTFFNLQIQP